MCDDVAQAQRTASAWMRANGADTGLITQVRLAVGTALLARHEPTGTVLRARRGRDGWVRWAPGRLGV